MRKSSQVAAASPPLDQTALRRVCGAYATGVAIVSAAGVDGAQCGLTINSFTSVSLDPPLILWSLRSASPSLPHFDGDGPFAISILAEGQNDLAMRFARPAEDKFDGVPVQDGSLGAPLIGGSVAHLECRPYSRMEAGDHIVFVWEVVAVSEAPLEAPLAFFGGKFHRISPLDEARAA